MSAILLIILIVGGFVIKSCITNSKVEGTYYLISITGNGEVVANKSENYIELNDGTCTLYLSLIQPAGNSILTYSYTGNRISNIEFNKDFINMDNDGKILINIDYGENYNNTFIYEKK